MLDFFVSYAAADRPWAEWISWVLEEAGKTVTLQAWDFRPGNNFVIEMQRAATEADRTLVVLSPDYLNSDFAMTEWAAAFAQDPTGEKGKVLPVQVREVKPGGLLAAIIYIDLVGQSEAAARERFLAGLARGRTKPAAPPPFPGGSVSRFPGGEDRKPAFPSKLTLPVAEIPRRGDLPPGSRMPLSQNQLFVGRESELRTLARQLGVKKTAARGPVKTAVASGMGGIGKTQLACEFVYRHGPSFAGGVFWMVFDKAENVAAEVADCGSSLGLHADFENLSLDRQIALVKEAWQSAIPRLLVFDNCHDENLLASWRPAFGGSRVLVTSWRTHWEPTLGVHTIPITTLPRSKSLELLRKYRPELAATDPALAAIAIELGDLPLALHLAGSYLSLHAKRPSGQPGAYLAALRQQDPLSHRSLRAAVKKSSPTRHVADVARTFALSYGELEEDNPIDALALALLTGAAWLAPGKPIPDQLLFLIAEVDSTGPAQADVTDEALQRLMDLGLLENNEADELLIHRLVALFVRSTKKAQAGRESVLRVLLMEANRLNNVGDPGPLLEWQVHLRAVTEGARDLETEVTVGLCNTLGFHLQMIGDYRGARPYYERALAIWEKVHGSDHTATAIGFGNLGELLRRLGDLAGAQRCYERALAIFESVLGPDHPDTANAINNLGFLLQERGELAQARRFYERALVSRERVLGYDHPDVAQSLNNLGALLYSDGALTGARSYLERALAILEAGRGSEHPNMRLVRENLEALSA